MDVFKAFLHGEIEETVCIKLPQGYKGLESRVSAAEGENCLADINLVCKIKESFIRTSTCTKKMVLEAIHKYTSHWFCSIGGRLQLFTKTTVEAITLVLVYVDDFVICGSSMKKSTYSRRTYHLHFI